MNLADLNKFLDKRISGKRLRMLIGSEVAEYTRSAKKLGSSMPISLVTNGETLTCDRSAILRLCLELKNGSLGEWDIYMICDALLLSENVDFSSEQVREVAESMTDPEVNGRLTSHRVQDILQGLGH